MMSIAGAAARLSSEKIVNNARSSKFHERMQRNRTAKWLHPAQTINGKQRSSSHQQKKLIEISTPATNHFIYHKFTQQNTQVTEQSMQCDLNSQEFKKLEFVIFCIESVASRLNIGATLIYEAMTKKSDILNSYILPSYEVLHTQSKDYIADDLINLMKEKGALP